MPLADATGRPPSELGSKAATLAMLAANGFLVPDGFVVPVDVEPSADELHQAAHRLRPSRFAVRSSAVAEDQADASYAGLYETFLNVSEADLADAVRRCRASAQADRIAAYYDRATDTGVAVLVQPMIDADSAGVAFTANPLTGARDETVITAVPGLGESLVSGEVVGEEWIVHGRAARPTRAAGVLTSDQAQSIADLARRVEAQLGGPQDIEWAIDSGQVYLLQARPMTALADPAVWDPPGPGLWVRNLRLGEWLPDPVTPLFADWLLKRLDEGFHQGMRNTAGAAVTFPYGVVNGWYYTRPNPSPGELPGAIIRSHGKLLPFMVNALIRPGRNPAAADRALLGELYRQWRDQLLPTYRELAARRTEGLSTTDLIRLIDQIGRTAGCHLWYLAVVGGAAWKMEAHLTHFLNGHHLTVSAQTLLQGLPGAGLNTPRHAVYSIDWYHPTAGEAQAALTGNSSARPASLQRQREHAERTCREQLAGRQRLQSAFTAALTTAQHYAVVREQQAGELTLGWPLLRDAVHRIGQTLTSSGVLDEPNQVFFLTRVEIEQHQPRGQAARQRHAMWEQQRRLAAPLSIGTPPPLIGRHLAHTLGLDRPADTDNVLTGQPASGGRATGPARIVHSVTDFDKVEDGDVLVARATAPAWTPLFSRIAAVITDGGTLAAHASLIAREYGIPAVVATAVATTRLRDGQIVTVDGTLGTVTITRVS